MIWSYIIAWTCRYCGLFQQTEVDNEAIACKACGNLKGRMT